MALLAEAILDVHLAQLESRTRAISLALATSFLRDVQTPRRVFRHEISLECPRATLHGLDIAVFAHHFYQHTLAQPAIGDPQPRHWERCADRIENGATREHELGALRPD